MQEQVEMETSQELLPHFVDRKCNVCGSGASKELLALQGTAYHICKVCGLIYARPMAENIIEINNEIHLILHEKYARKALAQRARIQKKLRMFERYRKTGNFIELGCNTGGVVLAAQDIGWKATGVDVSAVATRFAREELGLSVFTGTLEEARYPDDYFDVVYSNSVMEHLAYPLQTLKSVLRILRPGGVFYADTVNWDSYTRIILGAGWRYLDPVNHVHLYTPENVVAMAKHAGFEVERIWTTGVRVKANAPGSTSVTPWYLIMSKDLLSLASRFTNKGDAIKFILRKPII